MTNRLARATSPYLRQHRDNPVDWYPWGEEAFAEARRSDRPVLLSVGYSACHWCHVMAHECFEDVEVAAIMNGSFVNVKVDREERPDVDAIYMDAVQAISGRGGWPMTVFCTPTGEPFFGGTYYPRESFIRLMRAVDEAWRDRRDELTQNIDALADVIGRTSRIVPANAFDSGDLMRRTIDALTSSFDAQWGGFGDAPKFPSTFALDLALHRHIEAPDHDLVSMVTTSLDAMASGGMYDHLGGGFARYSVDRRWLVPHFEKMLYDQALLVRVYTHAAVALGEPRYADIVSETIGYVLDHLTSPDGAFYCAEDADSMTPDGHSEEGAFYTWTPAEVEEILGDRARHACQWWDITVEGNFEGRSIPNRVAHRGDWLRPADIEADRAALLHARNRRPRPGLDDKVLTEWNAMMLSSLCEAAIAFGDDDWRRAAERAGAFLVNNLRSSDGSWRRAWHGDGPIDTDAAALSMDLAHVVDAMTRLHELTTDPTWLAVAESAATRLVEEFWDHEHGGLFTVSSRGERLVARQKDLLDNATPSANSVAATAFLRLAALTGNASLRERAWAILRLLEPIATQAPTATCVATAAMHLYDAGAVEVVVPGDEPAFIDVVREQWRPHVVLARGATTTSPLWEGRHPGFAYVCRNMVCDLPARTPDELRNQLTIDRDG